MNKVFCTGTGVFTPLGNTPDELFDAVREGRSAFHLCVLDRLLLRHRMGGRLIISE